MKRWPFFNKKRKNVIILLLDQFRLDSLDNYIIFKTLKERGVLFSQMFTYAPYTVASLHAIFSGLYGRTSGVDAYFSSLKFKKDKCFTLAQYLKKEGYFTQADTINEILLPRQGFDKFLVYDEANVDITQRHIGMLKEANSLKTPFFLFLHYGLIHKKIVENVIKVYNDFDANYFGSLSQNLKRYAGYAQEAAGYLESLFSQMELLQLFSNSLIIVLTDHGAGVGEKPGEKAYGIYTYDYSIKIWAYFICQGKLPANRQIRQVVRSIDILPTIMELLRIRPSKKHSGIEGRSLVPLITGKDIEDRIAFVETGGLDGPTPSPDKPNVKCIRTKDWKLIYNTTTKKRELYNLSSDPAEIDNLSGRHPEIENKLWDILKSYLETDATDGDSEIIRGELKKMGYLSK